VLGTYTCAEFLSDVGDRGNSAKVRRSLMMISWAAGYAAARQTDASSSLEVIAMQKQSLDAAHLTTQDFTEIRQLAGDDHGAKSSTLPHQSDQLWHSLPRVKHLRKGDVVAFGSGDSSGHVGIYIGHGRFIHAVGAGKGVQIGWLHGRHAHRGYLGAVRPKVRLHRARQASDAV
jgi:cell wall-associated NlpC family hydrolase